MATIVTTKKTVGPGGARIVELVHEEYEPAEEDKTPEAVLTKREKRDAAAAEKKAAAAAAKAAKAKK